MIQFGQGLPAADLNPGDVLMSELPPSQDGARRWYPGSPASSHLTLAFLSTNPRWEVMGTLKGRALSHPAFLSPWAVGPTSPVAQPTWHSALRNHVGRGGFQHEKELHVGW